MRLIERLKLHRQGGIIDLFIIEIRLEIRKRRSQLDRKGHDLKALIDQILIPQLFKNPPDRLHKGRIHRPIGMIKIDPAADAIDRFFPFTRIAKNDLAALFIKIGDAELLNRGSSG